MIKLIKSKKRVKHELFLSLITGLLIFSSLLIISNTIIPNSIYVLYYLYIYFGIKKETKFFKRNTNSLEEAFYLQSELDKASKVLLNKPLFYPMRITYSFFERKSLGLILLIILTILFVISLFVLEQKIEGFSANKFVIITLTITMIYNNIYHYLLYEEAALNTGGAGAGKMYHND